MKKGFTLLEVMIAMVVLGIALTSLLVTLSGSVKLNAATREQVIAQNAMLEVIARVREELRLNWGATLYKYTGREDKYAMYYPVEGLDPYDNHPEVARVQVMLVENLKPYYDAYPSRLGDPTKGIEWGVGGTRRIDMNGDGNMTGDFTAWSSDDLGTLRIVPVVVKLEWQSKSGRDKDKPGRGFLYRHLLITRQQGGGGN